MHANRLLHGSALGLLCLACGCATPGFLKFSKDDFPKAGPKNPVVQIAAFWQPSNGIGIDKRACRGFAGQILFITDGSPTPALVDGTVRIYLYDDQGSHDERARPIHQFDFVPDAWKAHASKGKLGLTYSVFIPYTRKGNHEAHCSLMLRFTPREGPLAFSEMINVELPGSKSKTKESKESNDGSYESDSDELSDPATDTAVQAAFTDMARKSGNPRRHPVQTVQQIAAEAAAEMGTAPSRARRQLDPKDEARLIREARARLEAGEFDQPEPVASNHTALRPAARNPLAEDDEFDGYEDDAVSSGDSLTSPRAGSRHVLRDAAREDEPADEHQWTPKKKVKPSAAPAKGRSTSQPRKHVLETQEPRESASGGQGRRETLTLSLSTN
jgi:hypothetical protein